MDTGHGTTASAETVEHSASVRIALGLEYDGSAFHGWQRQTIAPKVTVQECLEQALSAVACRVTRSYCAGRTDVGVHACAQVVHFDAPSHRQTRDWLRGANHYLPQTVRVLWSRQVAADFHARFSASSRSYRYLICNRREPLALFRQQLAWEREPLNAEAMHTAAQCLLGLHDFSAFRAAGCHSSSPQRRVLQVAVRRHGDLVAIDIEANSFLLHMVRNLAGTLIAIGHGDKPPSWCAELLHGRDRRLAAPTAPTAGLYFLGAHYDATHGVPAPAVGSLLAHWAPPESATANGEAVCAGATQWESGRDARAHSH